MNHASTAASHTSLLQVIIIGAGIDGLTFQQSHCQEINNVIPTCTHFLLQFRPTEEND